MKGLILLASGFEDTEAIATIDILRRAKINIDLCSVNNEEEILTQNKMVIKPDTNSLLFEKMVIKPELFIKNINYKEYDFLVIPGGKAVSKTLINLSDVNEMIHYFNNEHKLIAAICAAPMLLGKAGILKGRKYTCFPGCEKGIEGVYTKKGVVVTGNIITGKSMAYTIDFALQIVKYLLGPSSYKTVKNAIFGK